jgi:hypothetical protein
MRNFSKAGRIERLDGTRLLCTSASAPTINQNVAAMPYAARAVIRFQ